MNRDQAKEKDKHQKDSWSKDKQKDGAISLGPNEVLLANVTGNVNMEPEKELAEKHAKLRKQ
ncbi:MAG: hypothetical protein SCK28_02830 [Bacillota bacterium]|nr:hypothetical protein [Bacillota bacterium]